MFCSDQGDAPHGNGRFGYENSEWRTDAARAQASFSMSFLKNKSVRYLNESFINSFLRGIAISIEVCMYGKKSVPSYFDPVNAVQCDR